MFKINRTTEYGLMALKHMSRKPQGQSVEVTSAREIADSYGLPFEITAKTLQRLKDTGIIQSAQGARGGYTLQRSLDEVTLAEFLELMEGPQSLVLCSPSPGGKAEADGKCSCEYHPRCELKNGMSNLNERLLRFFSDIRLNDFIGGMGTASFPLTPNLGATTGDEP